MKKRIISGLMAAMLILSAVTGVEMPETQAADTSIDKLIDGMSTKEKITQKLMVDFRQWNNDNGETEDMTVLDDEVEELIGEYKFGSIILFAENIKTTKETVALTKDMQEAVMDEGGIPMFIATDQEGGKVYRLGSGTALPGNMALAATGDSKYAKKAGGIIGSELSSVGINTTLAPVIDVNNNANNPIIGIRSFSDDASVVGEFGGKYIDGLQQYDIIGCAKHFPGHGDTATDSHMGLPEVKKSKKQLLKNELAPYKSVIADGIDMIMTAHILYPKLDNTKLLSEKTNELERRPATLSKKIVTGLLRKELGFKGVVITDAMNMKGIKDYFSVEQATLEAFKAGVDIVCMPVTGVPDRTEWKKQMDAIIERSVEAVEDGELSEKALDSSVKRILKLKKKRGILDYKAKDYTVKKAVATLGSAANRKLERKIAAKAVTVVKNKNNTLPLKVKKNEKVLMLATYDNERAQMVLGFNRAKKAGVIPESAEVRVYRFSEDDYEIKGALQENLDWADTVIATSEVTNTDAMAYDKWTSIAVKGVTEYCKSGNKTCVVMSIFNPYDVQLYPEADAILATYGSRGSAIEVTDKLLSGSTAVGANAYGPNIIAGVEVALGVYDASGKLPVDVPVFDAEKRVYTDKVKYKRGFGLTYKK